MSAVIEWLDAIIKRLQENLKQFQELRDNLIKHPEFDSASSADAERLIAESMPEE